MGKQKEFEDMYEEEENESWGTPVNSYREIVLRCIEKCRVEKSKELTKGKTIFIEKNGASIPIIIPDQRKVVESCINELYDELLWYFDDKAKEILPKIVEEIENLNQKYYEKYLKKETHIPSRQFAINNLQIGNTPLGNVLMQDKEDERNKLYRKLYQELLLLFKRENDLSNTFDIGLGDD